MVSFFGLNSIGKFENEKLERGAARHTALLRIAPEIANFATINLDHNRFQWVRGGNTAVSDMTLASDYAKGWTCSISADQNAQTRYRNWRKDQQELAISTALVELGYTSSSYKGIIRKKTDIKIGEFTQELKVQGRTRQKADLIVRSKKTKRLVLIEAKAVGVEIDSTKRIKECCDKSSDWRSASDLQDPVVVAVIAGFFNSTGIENMLASHIQIVWEHRLTDLKDIL